MFSVGNAGFRPFYSGGIYPLNYNNIASVDAEPVAITNKLAVSDGSNGVNDYVLYNGASGVGFYKRTGSALASGKVYLPASAVAGARSFIGFDDEDW